MRSQYIRVALIGSSRRLRGAAPNSRVFCNHTSQSLPFTYVRHHVTDREQDRDVTDREQDRDRVFDRNATYFKLLPCASCQPFIHYRLYVILFGLCISSVCHAFLFLSLSFSFTLSVPLSPVLS